MTHKIKKKVMIMVHEIKNSETKKLPRLGIHISWGWLAGLAVIAGLIWACGATISTVVGIYLGYKILRLVIRLFGQIATIIFTLISILIMLLIISLIIILIKFATNTTKL